MAIKDDVGAGMAMSFGRVAALGLMILLLPAGVMAADKRILVFGDSNSWGWIPRAEGVPTTRYPSEQQWPRVMQAELGAGHEVVVDALSGRTTDIDDPTAPLSGAGMNGRASLPAVIGAHLPLDLVVIMLGTNDTKAMFKRSPLRIALGAGELVDIVQASGGMFGGGWYSYPAPKVLLVAPPPLAPQKTLFSDTFDNEAGVERSRGLAAAYAAVAKGANVPFFDAGQVIAPDGADAVHLTPEAHRKLGSAVAAEVRGILSR